MTRRIPVILWLALIGVSNAADEPKRPPVREPELRGELLRRAKADQDARHAIVEWMTRHHGGEVADEAAFEASLDPTRKAEFERFAAETNPKRLDQRSNHRPDPQMSFRPAQAQTTSDPHGRSPMMGSWADRSATTVLRPGGLLASRAG